MATPSRRTSPQGVAITQTMQSAGTRALDAHRRARLIAESVSEELGEITAPHVAFEDFEEEDSAVHALQTAIEAHAPQRLSSVAAPAPTPPPSRSKVVG